MKPKIIERIGNIYKISSAILIALYMIAPEVREAAYKIWWGGTMILAVLLLLSAARLVRLKDTMDHLTGRTRNEGGKKSEKERKKQTSCKENNREGCDAR